MKHKSVFAFIYEKNLARSLGEAIFPIRIQCASRHLASSAQFSVSILSRPLQPDETVFTKSTLNNRSVLRMEEGTPHVGLWH